jgi:hypothetical protein
MLWNTGAKTFPDGVVFTGIGKLVRKATGYEEQTAEAALFHIGFADCAGRTSQRRLDIGDPQIPPTRLKFN